MKSDSRITNFLVADDHSLIRQAIVLILNAIGIEYKVFHASTIQQITKCVEANHIDIAIIDVYFPDGNSLHLIPEIKISNPEIKILIFTGIDEDKYSLKFLKAGADGFLSKLSEENEVEKAILQIINEGQYISQLTQSLLMTSLRSANVINPLSCLTEKELQIAEMHARGYGNLEISNMLNVRQNTISTTKKRIFQKLGIDNIVELIDLIKIHSESFL